MEFHSYEKMEMERQFSNMYLFKYLSVFLNYNLINMSLLNNNNNKINNDYILFYFILYIQLE